MAPTNDVDAQFSLQYSVALGLVVGRAGLDEYASPYLDDPIIRAVAARVKGTARPDFDLRFPEVWPAEMTITLADGSTRTAYTDTPKGDPANRLTPDEAQAKFRGLAGVVFDGARLGAIENAVRRIEEGGVSPLVLAVSG